MGGGISWGFVAGAGSSLDPDRVWLAETLHGREEILALAEVSGVPDVSDNTDHFLLGLDRRWMRMVWYLTRS